MAPFPRLVGGSRLALSRTDGENISLARSTDGVIWDDTSGNLVDSHGVGDDRIRVFSIDVAELIAALTPV